MKLFNLIGIVILSFVLALASCSGDTPSANTTNSTPSELDLSPTPAPAPAGTVFHYICPNNCAGSGADAGGTCPVCGTAYAHNQAWHDTQVTPIQGLQTGESATLPAKQPGNSPLINPAATPVPPKEPAQNAAGVWHYTCSAGCAGGAGSAVPCSKCGATLAHNATYHQ